MYCTWYVRNVDVNSDQNNLLPSAFHLRPRQLDVNHTLFEKDGVFGFHVSTCHLEQLVAVAEDMFTLYSTDRSMVEMHHLELILPSIAFPRLNSAFLMPIMCYACSGCHTDSSQSTLNLSLSPSFSHCRVSI